jgi:hypothetical protein
MAAPIGSAVSLAIDSLQSVACHPFAFMQASDGDLLMWLLSVAVTPLPSVMSRRCLRRLLTHSHD